MASAALDSADGGGGISKLADLCRNVIVKNLERFPPSSFMVLDEQEWETIVSLRQERTRPQKGTGGLDGSGRMVPAISDKFLRAVEEEVPFLSRSKVVDDVVWKDCVAHRFKEGGLTRPDGLKYPWPILVERLRTSGEFLLSVAKKEKVKECEKAMVREKIQILNESPMNIDLLQESGVGKSVKKFLKYIAAHDGSFLDLDQPLQLQQFLNSSNKDTRRQALDAMLERWMSIAAQSGAQMKDNFAAFSDAKTKRLPNERELKLAKQCTTWRDLFAVLSDNNETRKSNQGARMRERREKLNQVRPKIVKVQPTMRKQLNGAILMSQNKSASGPSKMEQLKMEANVTSARRQPPAPTKPPPKKGGAALEGSGFGAAVAFASISKGGTKRKASTTIVALNGGKRMKIPDAKRAGSNLKKKLGLGKGVGRR